MIAGASMPVATAQALPHVLLALIVVIVTARGLGALFARVRQPPVIGELVAGILLGPSLLGHLAPDASAALFSADVSDSLSLIAQVGIVFFMFLVGLELDAGALGGGARGAFAIANASIIVPFAMGVALAVPLYPSLAPPSVPLSIFSLFLGVAMSVTAFPVLARLLRDRRLEGTPLGATALSVAAIGDVTAWILLALIVGVVRASAGDVVETAALTLCYIAGMLLIVHPLMTRALEGRAEGSRSLLAAILVGLLLSAWVAELIGIHAIFGAFLMGVVVPSRSAVARALVTKLEDVTMILFLPPFFAFSGMRTQIGLLETPDQWLTCAVIIVVATVGKFGGTLAAGRLTGMPWRSAIQLGILMNTRGLMELVVLNVGLDLGVISPALFSMMVLMALVTTFAATPLLDLMKKDEALTA